MCLCVLGVMKVLMYGEQVCFHVGFAGWEVESVIIAEY